MQAYSDNDAVARMHDRAELYINAAVRNERGKPREAEDEDGMPTTRRRRRRRKRRRKTRRG